MEILTKQVLQRNANVRMKLPWSMWMPSHEEKIEMLKPCLKLVDRSSWIKNLTVAIIRKKAVSGNKHVYILNLLTNSSSHKWEIGAIVKLCGTKRYFFEIGNKIQCLHESKDYCKRTKAGCWTNWSWDCAQVGFSTTLENDEQNPSRCDKKKSSVCFLWVQIQKLNHANLDSAQ